MLSLWTTSFFMAFITDALENHALAEHVEMLGDLRRDLQDIEVWMAKIQYLATGCAMQVVMAGEIGIEPLGSAEYFDDIHDTDPRKSQQGTVDRVIGYVGVLPAHDAINGIGRGMIVPLDQLTVDRNPLRRDFQVMRMTGFNECLDFLRQRRFLHIYTK
jgi:hypothetical protein